MKNLLKGLGIVAMMLATQGLFAANKSLCDHFAGNYHGFIAPPDLIFKGSSAEAMVINDDYIIYAHHQNPKVNMMLDGKCNPEAPWWEMLTFTVSKSDLTELPVGTPLHGYLDNDGSRTDLTILSSDNHEVMVFRNN